MSSLSVLPYPPLAVNRAWKLCGTSLRGFNYLSLVFLALGSRALEQVLRKTNFLEVLCFRILHHKSVLEYSDTNTSSVSRALLLTPLIIPPGIFHGSTCERAFPSAGVVEAPFVSFGFFFTSHNRISVQLSWGPLLFFALNNTLTKRAAFQRLTYCPNWFSSSIWTPESTMLCLLFDVGRTETVFLDLCKGYWPS